MPKRGKKQSRKIKFYMKNYKIPESQQKMLKQFIKQHQTTENKVFRKALREYLQSHAHLFEHIHTEIGANQLKLFDMGGDEQLGNS